MTQPTTQLSANPQSRFPIKGFTVLPLNDLRVVVYDPKGNHVLTLNPEEVCASRLMEISQNIRLSEIQAAEARFYGEPDDATFKRDRVIAHRAENKKPAVDTSDFVF